MECGFDALPTIFLLFLARRFFFFPPSFSPPPFAVIFSSVAVVFFCRNYASEQLLIEKENDFLTFP